ncbi:MAG: MotA/TolQ/ExbB proton channel family protein [Planctomycetaceae bacterium]|nr:MotA/TolQ/ExbB proton channel family protein [Planctomycetaceae bacterium]
MLELLLSVLEMFVWLALFGESVCAVSYLAMAGSRVPLRSLNAEIDQLRTMSGTRRRFPRWIHLTQVLNACRPGVQLDELLVQISLALHRIERSALPLSGFLMRSAPFLGLLGTVLGVSQTLDAYAAAPGELTALFEGISLALMSTLLGMIVALVSMLAATKVNIDLKQLKAELITGCLSLRSRLHEEHQRDQDRFEQQERQQQQSEAKAQQRLEQQQQTHLFELLHDLRQDIAALVAAQPLIAEGDSEEDTAEHQTIEYSPTIRQEVTHVAQ